MKVLAINGSPHSGNTTDKVEAIGKLLLDHEDVKFETVDLRGIDLKPCKGCFQCFIRGEEYCPLRDDKKALSDKMEEADGVIFASPVYSMHVTYLMKLFVDRFSYNFHRPRYYDKRALIVAVTGSIGLKEATRYLRGVASCWGFEVIGSINYRAAPKNTPMGAITIGKDRTEEMVKRFYESIKNDEPRRLAFKENLNFRMMQSMYSRMEEMSPRDHQYWQEKGWLEKKTRFFTDDVRCNVFKDVIARSMALMAVRRLDKAMTKDE